MAKQQRIGDLLVARSIISRSDAESAAVDTVLSSTRMASTLVKQGKLDEHQALEMLSEQLGVPAIDLTKVVVPKEALSRVPRAVAVQYTLLPLAVDGSNIIMAMANPVDTAIHDEVSFATGLRVVPFVGLHFRMVEAINKAYSGTGEYRANDAVGSSPDLPVVAHTLPDEPELSGEIAVEVMVETEEESLELTAAEAQPPRLGGQAAVSEQQTILVVDDEPEIQQLVIETLKSPARRIVTAGRGIEALHLVKSEKPDLMVLDAMLPEVHGFEICRKVKQSKRFGHTPVLMISAIYRGWRIAEDIKALYKVDAFLEKPFRIADLRRHAERLLAAVPSVVDEDPTGQQAKRAYDQAITAFKQQDLGSAFRHLRQAESLEPFSAKVQFMLGRVLEMQEGLYQAIYHYERAVELNPHLFPAAKSLALLYQTQGFKNKAVEMWERSLQCAPSEELRDQIKGHLVSIL